MEHIHLLPPLLGDAEGRFRISIVGNSGVFTLVALTYCMNHD
jgi:hypothetical protein